MKKTKIVATMGPASTNSKEVLKEMILSGTDSTAVSSLELCNAEMLISQGDISEDICINYYIETEENMKYFIMEDGNNDAYLIDDALPNICKFWTLDSEGIKEKK